MILEKKGLGNSVIKHSAQLKEEEKNELTWRVLRLYLPLDTKTKALL